MLPALLLLGKAFCQQVCIEIDQVDLPVQAVFGTPGQLLIDAQPSLQLTLKPGHIGWQRIYLYTRIKTPIRVIKVSPHSTLCSALFQDSEFFAKSKEAKELPSLLGATLLAGIEFDVNAISDRYYSVLRKNLHDYLLTNLDVYLEYIEGGVFKKISIPVQACMR